MERSIFQQFDFSFPINLGHLNFQMSIPCNGPLRMLIIFAEAFFLKPLQIEQIKIFF